MLQRIRAIIVDDESHCIENLRYHISKHCDRLDICGTGTDVRSLLQLCADSKPDVAFLDIHLFDINILDVMHALPPGIAIVFVTAYDKHALDAFRASAIDYLLKPIDAAEIKRCYEKIVHFIDGRNLQSSITYPSKNIQLRSGDSLFIIRTSEILLLNAKGFYTEVIFLHKGVTRSILLSKPLTMTCKDFNDENLVRIHRSHAVNVRRIEHITRGVSGMLTVTISCYNVPVSKSQARQFKDKYHG